MVCCTGRLLLVRRELLLLGVMFDMRGDQNLLIVSEVDTRQDDKVVFKTDIVHYDIYKRSPFYIGTQLWNRLSSELHNLTNKKAYKNDVKRLYLTCVLQGHILILEMSIRIWRLITIILYIDSMN